LNRSSSQSKRGETRTSASLK